MPRGQQACRHHFAAVPKANAPNAICVTDGQIVAGTVVPAEDTYVAFTPDGVVVGEYPTLKAATDAARRRWARRVRVHRSEIIMSKREMTAAVRRRNRAMPRIRDIARRALRTRRQGSGHAVDPRSDDP
jgi:hypothetical protein